ncbi:copper resistance protein CopC [Bacillus licheniformis]|nr:copper resistance protein CopC [Bacillus licheniformis]
MKFVKRLDECDERATLWAVLAVLCTILLPKPLLLTLISYNQLLLKSGAEKAPEEIKIEFNEAIQNGFHSITVRNSSGERVDSGKRKSTPNAKIMTVKLKPKLKDDIYSAEWRAVSADGHPVSGTIPFSIGNIQGGLPKDQQIKHQACRQPISSLNASFVYRFLPVHGSRSFQLVWHRPETAGRVTKAPSEADHECGALIDRGCHHHSAATANKTNAGVSWIGAFQPSLLKETLLNTTGGTLWLINIAIIALLVSLRIERPEERDLEPVPFAGLLFVKSLDGHAASTSAGYMTIAMNFIHLNAASIWTGGLAMFVLFSERLAEA